MEFKNTINGTIVIIVAVCLICGMLVPIIDGIASGEPGQTNEGAGWIRMNYDTSASTYTISLTPTGDGVSVTNGTDTQTGSDETILYADSNVAVWIQDSAVNVLGQNTDGPQFLQPEDTITITRTAEGVTIVSGEDSLSFATPDWAYIPISSGNYGFFEDGTAVATNSPIAAVGGGFAGVYAYNDIARYAGLGLQLQTVMEDGKLTGAYWAKPAAPDSLSITPLDPGSITIQPLDPSILDPEPDVSIMTVPTPTYTDGVWGYDLDTIDGVQKAIIVSYSGNGGDVVVPATVGGYAVHRVGKLSPTAASGSDNVINNASLAENSTLTISDGIVEIGRYAFNSCSRFAGSLILPDSITAIGSGSFTYCRFSDALVVPDSVSTIGVPFIDCNQVKQLVIASDATPGNNSAFSMTGVQEVLDLSSTIDYSVNRYGIAAGATVQDNIGDSAGYISFVKTEGSGVEIPDSIKGLMFAIPVVILASLLVAIAIMAFKRDY